jgi:hypothetical protein
MSPAGWSVLTPTVPLSRRPSRTRKRPSTGSHLIRRILVLRPLEGQPVDALESGYDRWECPCCGDDLGACRGSESVRLAQRCVCGAVVVEVWCT